MMMMMVDQGRSFNRHPFTETQLKEFELQTLIFNYIASGIPIPSHLTAHFRRSFYFLDPYPLHLSMGIGRRAEEDPEPWRCKRTDGKKWRCSKEAFQDSKYCERHMHRGKKSSRKLVESPSAADTTNNTTPPPLELFLASPSYKLTDDKSYRSECYNFFKDEEKSQQHCYVLGADLMQEVQKPKPLLFLFNECADTEEAYSKTQLSISIP